MMDRVFMLGMLSDGYGQMTIPTLWNVGLFLSFKPLFGNDLNSLAFVCFAQSTMHLGRQIMTL